MKIPSINNTIRMTAVMAVAALTLASASIAETAKESAPEITLAMIEKAQNDWGDGLVAISKAQREGGDPKALATTMLETLYAFPDGQVLFKPTLASGDQTFRPTFPGALAYFVGGNPDYPNDSGFALSAYDSHRSDIDSYIVDGKIAIVMGHVWLKTPEGKEVMVDKTFAYKLDDDGKLRIITHHSSLPFTP